MGSSLEPLGSDLSNEGRALAEALRSLFTSLGVTVRRYGARRHRDAGSISRFLNGARIPTWDFIFELLSDVAEHRGSSPTLETIEHLRGLHRRALAASGSASHRIQVLEAQLEDADRQARRSEVRERALEDALLDAQRRTAEVELEMRQLQASDARGWTPGPSAVQAYEDQFAELRRERDQLRDQVEMLREELQEAHARRVLAEQRCEELERQLVTAEEGARVDAENQARQEAVAETERAAVLEEEIQRLRRRVAILDEKTKGDIGTHAGGVRLRLGERLTEFRGRDLLIPRDELATRLNPRYEFENFAIGVSNRFAHAAATAVAEAPSSAYNPLLIYGESGVGKTHLLHAVGHYARSLYPGIRVRYVSSEEFANEFINSIRDGKGDLFRKDHREMDILLVDDIQFLASKESTQEEFFHTFNTLYNADKQIVLSADRPLDDLMSLAPQLRSRLAAGLSVGMQLPDSTTRIAFVRNKAAQDQLDVPDEVLEFIANCMKRSIRELEGALVRVSAYARINGEPVTLPVAKSVLQNLILASEGATPEVTADAVLAETAAFYGLTVDALRSTERRRVLVAARNIAMYLCRELADLPVPTIAALFGGRDTSTVIRADRKIRALMAERQTIYNQVTDITTRILHAPPS